MRRIWALGLILFISLMVLKGQNKQYVVKITGDTLYGKLMINPVRDNSTSILFKVENGSRDRLRPLRYNYVYYSPKYQFRSVPYRNQRLFMQIVWEEEHIKLYNYVHQRDNSVVTSRLAIKPDLEAVELSVLTFKAQMSDFLEDCPSVVAKIEDKVYRFKNHQEMFLDYNKCMMGLQTPAEPVSASNSTPAQPSPPAADSKPSKPELPIEKDKKINTDDPEVAVIPSTQETTLTDIQVLRLRKIDEFKSYVQGLDGFQSRDDVMELLFDVENRIRDQRNIPDYLWSILESMVESNPELSAKARDLQLNIQ